MGKKRYDRGKEEGYYVKGFTEKEQELQEL